MRKLKIKITLTEPMLGTKSANDELFTKYIAGKRPEGVATDEAEAERRMNEKIIDGQIFVDERRIPLVLPEGGEIGICERPLRAQTMQGERVALAKSESVPAGTTFAITISMLNPDLEDVVREWLDYGALRGIGQWRNSGMGRIKWEEVK